MYRRSRPSISESQLGQLGQTLAPSRGPLSFPSMPCRAMWSINQEFPVQHSPFSRLHRSISPRSFCIPTEGGFCTVYFANPYRVPSTEHPEATTSPNRVEARPNSRRSKSQRRAEPDLTRNNMKQPSHPPENTARESNKKHSRSREKGTKGTPKTPQQRRCCLSFPTVGELVVRQRSRVVYSVQGHRDQGDGGWRRPRDLIIKDPGHCR